MRADQREKYRPRPHQDKSAFVAYYYDKTKYFSRPSYNDESSCDILPPSSTTTAALNNNNDGPLSSHKIFYFFIAK